MSFQILVREVCRYILHFQTTRAVQLNILIGYSYRHRKPYIKAIIAIMLKSLKCVVQCLEHSVSPGKQCNLMHFFVDLTILHVH